jgi:hypothetical protein
MRSFKAIHRGLPNRLLTSSMFLPDSEVPAPSTWVSTTLLLLSFANLFGSKCDAVYDLRGTAAAPPINNYECLVNFDGFS